MFHLPPRHVFDHFMRAFMVISCFECMPNFRLLLWSGWKYFHSYLRWADWYMCPDKVLAWFLTNYLPWICNLSCSYFSFVLDSNDESLLMIFFRPTHQPVLILSHPPIMYQRLTGYRSAYGIHQVRVTSSLWNARCYTGRVKIAVIPMMLILQDKGSQCHVWHGLWKTYVYCNH